jgi:hypothetical protein
MMHNSPGSFKNLVGKKLRLDCDINLKLLKNLCTQDFNKVIDKKKKTKEDKKMRDGML